MFDEIRSVYGTEKCSNNIENVWANNRQSRSLRGLGEEPLNEYLIEIPKCCSELHALLRKNINKVTPKLKSAFNSLERTVIVVHYVRMAVFI